MLVACSGGADSLALLAATVFEGHKQDVHVVGVTVDHALQESSAAQAEHVVTQMAALGVDETVSVRVQVTMSGQGPEAAAREARYAVLEEVAQRLGSGTVLLGHTLDDQAETVLLGLARGSGGRSLAGMRRGFDVFRRPLLDVTREQTEAACLAEGIEWWTDPHNEDPRFARSRVRHRVLPVLEEELGPGVSAALARTADQLRADTEALDEMAAASLIDAAVAPDADDYRTPDLGGLPWGLKTRVLRLAALGAGRDRLRADLPARAGGLRPRPRPGGLGSPQADPAARPRHGLPGRRPPEVPAHRCDRLTSMDEKDVEGDLVDILFTEEQIQARLGELAAEIQHDYEGKDILLVGVLRGAVMVMADLARHFSRHLEMDWMAISSYGSGTKSSGVVRILKDLDTDITNRHVLVVEDIIDTGLTLTWLVSNLSSRGPASVEICTLLRKPEAQQMTVDVKYVGYDIPNEFVVGYGLDYAERYRNLRSIGTLARHVYT